MMTNVEFLQGLSNDTLRKIVRAINNERANITAAMANDLIKITSDDDYQYWMQADLALADLKQTAMIIRGKRPA